MASITIRDLDDETKERLRQRAAMHQNSMEEEARQILREAMARDDATPVDLASAIGLRFKKLGGVELEVAPREPIREPPRGRR